MTLAGSAGTTRRARIARGTRATSPLLMALVEWQAAVVRQDQVDPVTTEVVRLRCAHHHDCHT